MSSSTASPSSSAPSSTYTSDDSGLGTTSTNSQLPFSFLLAFVSIFIFLVACGFGTRRLSTQLQRTMMNAACQCIRQPPVPGLYDVCRKREKCVSRYCDLLPLSVSYVREEMDTDAPLSSEPHVQVPELPRRLRILEFVPFVSIFLAIRTLRRMRAVHAADAAGMSVVPSIPEPSSPPVRAVSISVLIAMPSPHRLRLTPTPRLSYAHSHASHRSIDIAVDAKPLAPIGEEHRRSSASSGKTRESAGYFRSWAEEADESSRVYAVGVVQVPWDSEVDLS